jgi:hypothetical protein
MEEAGSDTEKLQAKRACPRGAVQVIPSSRAQRRPAHNSGTISHNFGYGVGDDMDSLLAKYGRQ